MIIIGLSVAKKILAINVFYNSNHNKSTGQAMAQYLVVCTFKGSVRKRSSCPATGAVNGW